MFWFFGLEACRILAPWPGIKPCPLHWKWSLIPWTTSEVPVRSSFLVFINSNLSTSNLSSLFSVCQPSFSPELEWKRLNASLCLYSDDPLILLPQFARVIFLSDKSYFVPLKSFPCHTENPLRSVPIYFSKVFSPSLSSEKLGEAFQPCHDFHTSCLCFCLTLNLEYLCWISQPGKIILTLQNRKKKITSSLKHFLIFLRILTL